ncbi:circadian clock protein PASD1 [Octodon degus]|uniref:Circadian clock protein PASD1 n=1 Tax=Octodon degus TaxID=10160 RepID=A0A6P6DQW9_OCTDE|nr:circadian clock protein PASD1 [Octodon degus]
MAGGRQAAAGAAWPEAAFGSRGVEEEAGSLCLLGRGQPKKLFSGSTSIAGLGTKFEVVRGRFFNPTLFLAIYSIPRNLSLFHCIMEEDEGNKRYEFLTADSNVPACDRPVPISHLVTDVKGMATGSQPAKSTLLTKEHYDEVFDRIRSMVHRHSSRRTDDKAQTAQTSTETTSETSDTASSSSMASKASFAAVAGVSSVMLRQPSSVMMKQEGNVNMPEVMNNSNWVPVFHDLEEMNQMMLQALDSTMIVLNTEGVIFFVTENITTLLGYLAHELMGQKITHFLPDEEKNEVYDKIKIRAPLSESVGVHIDFCCHFRRGNVKEGINPIYEHVKFILTLRDICSRSFLFFGGFVPNCLCIEPVALKFPMEERFYLVGCVCLINTAILKDLYTAKRYHETLIKDSDEDPLMIRRCLEATTYGDQDPQVKVEPRESEYVVPDRFEVSSPSSETSISSSEVIPDSLTTTFHAFVMESMMDPRRCQEPIDLEFSVDSCYLESIKSDMQEVQQVLVQPVMERVLMEPVVPEILIEPKVKEDLSSSDTASSHHSQVGAHEAGAQASDTDQLQVGCFVPVKDLFRQQTPSP